MVWHLYGGRDFGPPPHDSSSSTPSPGSSPLIIRRGSKDGSRPVTPIRSSGTNGSRGLGSGASPITPRKYSTSPKSSSPTVVFGGVSKVKGRKVTGGKRPGGTQEWKTAGGPGRDHNILMELELDKVTSALPTATQSPLPLSHSLLPCLALFLYISILQSSLLPLCLLHGVSPPFLFSLSLIHSLLSTLSCHLSSACSCTLSIFLQTKHRHCLQLLLFFSPQLRIQHEVYPPDTEQASRLVLLVHDVEMRDRLAHSQINKFLYQYTTEAMPRQSHANMVHF